MTDLSPAAAKIFNAAWADTGIILGDCEGTLRAQLAAVLRAAADQVVPKTPTLSYPEDYELGVWVANDDVRTELLSIAAELEGAQ